jgi:FAD/FMN-containing dehydrogenase
MISIDDLAGRFHGRVLTAPDDVEPFLVDWRKLWRGRAMAVVQPDTPQDVAAVVRWCAERDVPIVPQGGNTGMSGGATPGEDGRAIVLSLARLNRIRDIDPVNDTVTLDAGCILQTVQDAAMAADRFFPLSLAAEGSCTIGGNLATNAGGTAVLRYGNIRALCLGIEVVTAQGELWDGLKGLRKDNSGYDLRDLFIGSEGTLGIITGAVLKLFPRPAARIAAFLAVDSPGEALDLLSKARGRFDERLTAFELLSAQCHDLVLAHFPTLRAPLQTAAPWFVLMELSELTDEQRGREDLEAFLADAFERGLVLDGAIAENIAQSHAFWALRENIADAQGSEGKTIKHDIALPISRVADFLPRRTQSFVRAGPISASSPSAISATAIFIIISRRRSEATKPTSTRSRTRSTG